MAPKSKRPTEDAFYQDYAVKDMPAVDMAKKYGVHVDTIYRWAEYFEISRERQDLRILSLKYLKDYEEHNMTQGQIAKKYGVSRTTAFRRVGLGRKVKAELMEKGMVGV